MNLWRDIKGTLQPFWITLGYLFTKPVTIQYPEEKRIPPPRYRARIVLTRNPDGSERCVACQLCSAACPVDCIYIDKVKSPVGKGFRVDGFAIDFWPKCRCS